MMSNYKPIMGNCGCCLSRKERIALNYADAFVKHRRLAGRAVAGHRGHIPILRIVDGSVHEDDIEGFHGQVIRVRETT